ncbi:hypothetical protein T484DRAFT_1661766 [Baffinella frigidus]|nr:hypothetical protein T484DRAFT_1661766 [Cryptophyta sp. CCMP2293]
MKTFVVAKSGSGLLMRSVAGRAVHSTPPTGANQAAQKQEPSAHMSGSHHASANTTSVPAGQGKKVPDFIINHVSPVHSGSQWITSKRASDSEVFGDAGLEGGYKTFRDDIKNIVPDSRVFTDPLRTLAYGTDASFYRLVPKIVVKVHDEVEMIKLIRTAAKNRTPVTFRAGGTSLSGQVSIIPRLQGGGSRLRLFPGVQGAGRRLRLFPGFRVERVNRMLAPYGRKLGPDPSSIDSCWIGGVVANNSSGMCCGVLQNTYHTIKELRMVFHDGTILDTADPVSWESFKKSHKHIVDGMMALSQRIKEDEALTALIKKKFSIKCTTGYSINALVDFDDAKEMIKHLMVGSEGTLGFVSRATYNTVPDYHNKSSAMIVFPTVEDASNATWELRKAGCADAVEIMDRRSLRTTENMEHLHFLRGLPEGATALLIECRGETKPLMEARIEKTKETISAAGLLTLSPIEFSSTPAVSEAYWNARRMLIPMVGAVRENGTSVLLEDVAVPVQNLAKLYAGVEDLFERFQYYDGSAFGHALEGNLHIVFTQGFETQAEVKRYGDMMDFLCKLVVSLDGSLKAEHGTGRNVAPYVEMEWGAKATAIMWELKTLFDPSFLLNPGVILNKNPNVHMENLKPLPVAHGVIDTCMECGFCESACPSGHVTLTPRQRIVATRELARLDARGEIEDLNKAVEMRKLYTYAALDTCAADGMCAEKCPVQINTGRMVKDLRAQAIAHDSMEARVADAFSSRFGLGMAAVPILLNTVDIVHALIGKADGLLRGWQVVYSATCVSLKWPDSQIGRPRGPRQVLGPCGRAYEPTRHLRDSVVYFATCVSRSMGPARGDSESASIHDKTMSVLAKAGYEVILPDDLGNACCGLIFDSRGLSKQGMVQSKALEASLLTASQGGTIPILCDTSPCLMRMKDNFTDSALKANMFEPTQFAADFLLDRLDITRSTESIAVHVPCSSKKMKKDIFFEKVAKACAATVTMSPVPCCGMAGDRGMRYPEISGGGVASSAAAPPGAAVIHRDASFGGNTTGPWTEVKSTCSEGFSTSRTCEISLSNSTGTHFKSIMYLLDRTSVAKQQSA